MKLNRKISLTAGIFTTSILLLLGFLVIQQWFSTLLHQLELTARDTAYAISEMEVVRENLVKSNGSIPIQRRMEEIRLSTRIQYIYVLDRQGVFYAHTIPGSIGTKGSDPFYLKLLQSDAPRTLVRRVGRARLTSVEAAAPVYYQGELAGLVVTGVLNGRVYQEISLNIQTFALIMILAVFISLYSSQYLSSSIKRSMQGLEPEEISRLLGQRAMTLDNLKEAIVTVDQSAGIIYFNTSAKKLIGLGEQDLDRPVEYFFFGESFIKCLSEKRTLERELKTPGGMTLQCRIEPIWDPQSQDVLGATAVMEDMTTVRLKAEELTGIKQINEGLRAQNHEFLNKLHTIAGLIQLEEYDQAVHYITGISRNRREITAQLSDRIKDPAVAGLLLGKYNKAQEQKTAFLLDEKSFLSAGTEESETINLILGNLIENALEELRGKDQGEIRISLYEKPGCLMIQVGDNGGGIAEPDYVFIRGNSTRGENRGLGLFLVRQKTQSLGGEIKLQSRPGETVFTVTLPVRPGREES